MHVHVIRHLTHELGLLSDVGAVASNLYDRMTGHTLARKCGVSWMAL